MEIKREITVAFTGNRTLTAPAGVSKVGLESRIRTLLFTLLEERYKQGKRNFISGLAIGFDLLAAEVVIELRKRYPDIKLIAAVPFMGQELMYSDEDKVRYAEVYHAADHIQLIWDGSYTPNAYHLRNDWMVAHSSELIAYHNGKPRSGTASTLRKATQQNIEAVNLFERI